MVYVTSRGHARVIVRILSCVWPGGHADWWGWYRKSSGRESSYT